MVFRLGVPTLMFVFGRRFDSQRLIVFQRRSVTPGLCVYYARVRNNRPRAIIHTLSLLLLTNSRTVTGGPRPFPL